MPIQELKLGLIKIGIPTPTLHLKRSRCKRLSLSESVWYGPCVISFYPLWPNCFSLGLHLHNIHSLNSRFAFVVFCFFFLNKKIKKIVLYILKMCNWGWPMKFAFHDCVLCLALMSFILLHFASLCYVVLILCELFMVFNHMILTLKSHSFDCRD